MGAIWGPPGPQRSFICLRFLLTFKYSAGFRPIRPKSAPRPPGTPLRTLPRPSQDPSGTPPGPPRTPGTPPIALQGPPGTPQDPGGKIGTDHAPPSPAGGGEGGGTICPNRVRKSMKTPQGGRPTKPLNHPVLMLPGPWLQRLNGGVWGGPKHWQNLRQIFLSTTFRGISKTEFLSTTKICVDEIFLKSQRTILVQIFLSTTNFSVDENFFCRRHFLEPNFGDHDA